MKLTEEQKKKLSESMKGNKNRLGYKATDETLQKRSGINKDKFIYNNGERNIFLRIGEEIPEGFVKGVFISEEDRQCRRERMEEINRKKWGYDNGESRTAED